MVMSRAYPKTLLVAATGGHLEELYRIRTRLTPECGETQWVTHDDPQSRSLLAGEQVRFVPYVPPRGYREIARNIPTAWRMIRDGGYDRVISTGAGVAVPFLAVGRISGLDCHYIESSARAEGPSVTGRIAAKIPGVRLYSQYEAWAKGDWNYCGSWFDNFDVIRIAPPAIRRVVVTLGTMRTYRFRRAVDRLLKILPEILEPDAEVLWQLGATEAYGMGGNVRSTMPNAELRQAMAEADLVIAHSGIGSAITALELGKRPVLLPRRPQFNEHVDDHQALIADELHQRNLAVSAEADEVDADDLMRAASGKIVSRSFVKSFQLIAV